MLCKTRGEHGALERIVLEMKGRGFVSGRVHIAHCGNPDAADRLKKMLHAVFPGAGGCESLRRPVQLLCRIGRPDGRL